MNGYRPQEDKRGRNKKKGFKIPTFNDSDEDVKEYDEMMMLMMLAGIL